MTRKIHLFLIASCLFAQNRSAVRPTAVPGPATPLLNLLRQEIKPDQSMKDVRAIWETDRWQTFPKFEETAKNVAGIMRRAGLEDVEIVNAAADGVTQSGFWTTPLAWDVKTGTLEIVEPEVPADQRVLADFQKSPASLAMWSGPTPAGGVVTEVVLAPRNLQGVDAKGKLVFGLGGGAKMAAVRAGALGLISDNTENRDLLDERGWINSFGDKGWAFNKGDTPLVCFSITPRSGQFLRELLKKGPVKVRANVDARFYAGVYPYVTGVIRGTDGANAEEVLSLGHLFEIGANDNATGVAAIIAAAENLNRLIQAGKLPRPKRNIRVLAMGECYGTMHYLQNNKERVKRTIAAMCIDSPAGPQNMAMTEYTWIMNPDSAKSYVDALTLRLAEEYFPFVGRPWRWMAHRSTTDNFLGDPSIGIPTVMPYGGYGVMAHHNSADTPETVDPKSMRDMIVMNAAFAYFVAAAGPAEKRWMAELALTHSYRQMAATTEKILDQISSSKDAEGLGRLLYNSQARIDYALERETEAVKSAWNIEEAIQELSSYAKLQKSRLRRSVRDRATLLGLGAVEPIAPAGNPEARKIVVKRKRMGTITLDDLPREKRENFPAASFFGVPVAALYWCDGQRNLEEVIRLTEFEMGPQQFDFVGYFKFLEKNGYVEFVR
ncbi:MAG TPA: M28 family peptidase [Bryobacteraceae bacterium]|nr:M28 family peptidase [Bryobacteraceae bacterium]